MIAALVTAFDIPFGIAGWESDANVASRNLSKAADMFEVNRRIIFYNGITNEHIAMFEGLCSLGNDDKPGQRSITCKTGPQEYEKHYLGLSDNVTYFAVQIKPSKQSVYHTRVVFKPQSIIPDMDVRGDMRDLMSGGK